MRLSVHDLRKNQAVTLGMWFLGYLGWIFTVRLIGMTVAVFGFFFFSDEVSNHLSQLHDWIDYWDFYWIGFSAMSMIVFYQSAFPIENQTRFVQLFDPQKIEKTYFPNFLRGYFVAGFVVLILILMGYYQYLGYYIPSEDKMNSFLGIGFRILMLLCFVYGEEFLFREKWLSYFPAHLPFWGVAHVLALFYCLIKAVQFELSWLQLTSLYLISLCLSYRRKTSTHFTQNAGYWAAILIVFHTILSLPIFGKSFSGVFLIKCLPFSGDFNWNSQETLIRWMTGGAGGPLSSLLFQLILILEILRSMMIQRKRGQAT